MHNCSSYIQDNCAGTGEARLSCLKLFCFARSLHSSKFPFPNVYVNQDEPGSCEQLNIETCIGACTQEISIILPYTFATTEIIQNQLFSS